MKQIVNHSAFHHSDPVERLIGEQNDGTSQTVPDMTLGIRELLTHYTNSGSAPGVKVHAPIDSELSDVLPADFERLDKLQQLDYKKALKKHVDEQQKAVQQQHDEIEHLKKSTFSDPKGGKEPATD